MTEIRLYGSRLNIPCDALPIVVPIPLLEDFTADPWGRGGWRQLYSVVVGIAGEDDVRERVALGVVVV